MTDEPQRYPATPGAKGASTSFEAAEAMRPTALRLRAKTLEAFKVRPLTADEAADAVGLSVLSIRPRVSELVRLGAIIDTGQRRRNASGRNAVVWSVKVVQQEEKVR